MPECKFSLCLTALEEPEMTYDVDIVYSRTLENVERVSSRDSTRHG